MQITDFFILMICFPILFLILKSSTVLQKPVNLLAFGVAAMLLSCLILSCLIFHVCKEFCIRQKKNFDLVDGMSNWNLDEAFILGVILIVIISMGSSSMVEEEQYIWHFVTSTLDLLLLRKTMQSLPVKKSFRLYEGTKKIGFQVYSIFVLIISGRTLRGWHQGGVNWTHLPDVSKWLEMAGSNNVKLVQLVSCLLIISLCFFTLSVLGSRRKFVLVVGFTFLVFGLLVLQHIMIYQENTIVQSSSTATLMVQIIFAVLGITPIGTFIALPLVMPISISKKHSSHDSHTSTPDPIEIQYKYPLVELKDSLYVIGWTYIGYWCLLQLMLQQPVNAVPILLILMQILASMIYSSYSGLHQKQWVEVSYVIIWLMSTYWLPLLYMLKSNFYCWC